MHLSAAQVQMSTPNSLPETKKRPQVIRIPLEHESGSFVESALASIYSIVLEPQRNQKRGEMLLENCH